MKKFAQALKPAEILAVCGGEYRGSEDLLLQSVADPAEADPASIIFWEQEKYLAVVQNSSAGLIFCTPEGASKLPGRNLILHPKPYFGLMRLVSWWLEKCSDKPQPGIHPSAVMDPSADVGEGVSLGANSVVGRNCRIGAGVCIGANCVLGDDVTIGAGTRLYPNVVVYPECEVGSDTIIHSGAVIGADGFGFILMDGMQHKIPQIGNVRIGNNVEIGANTAIDRGTLSTTLVGDGTKIDNHVQIGHNCRIGRHCILCAHVGLAGSTILGDYVYLAGQVGAAGHLTIGDRAMIGAQAGVTSDIPADGRYLGSPAVDANTFKRNFVAQKHLPEIYRNFIKQQKNHPDKD
ncbi:MAG: UDP-3-O-(3-hydroxymyristoyl)glucosamine N-acyltransferase [Candidatus Syntrophosphaera sp.]|nr:UDP-3-O-(3-hydroxymyristoyl)glucosamine N-acyltransferase [Candidatus Syntrophosphaera sp.]